MANVQITNYDINKQAYQKMSPLTNEQIQEKQEELRSWIYNFYTRTNYQLYIGILCREIYDFTIVHIDKPTAAASSIAAENIIETLQSRGEILDIEHRKDDFGDSYQCWVRVPMISAEIDLPVNTEDYNVVRLYVLFDATDWVVEV